MIAGAVVLPQPPLLLPGLTGRPDPQVEVLRDACVTALKALVAVVPDRLVVIGARRASEAAGIPGAHQSLDTVDFRPPAGEGVRCVPALAVAATLLDQAGIDLTRIDWAVVDASAPPADCASVGEGLVAGPERIALVAVGDGSARRRVGSPGRADERAIDVDTGIEKAMAQGDLDEILGLQPELAEELLIGGRAAWQVLAGALRSLPDVGPAPVTVNPGRRARISYSDDPFGVWYVVASFAGQ